MCAGKARRWHTMDIRCRNGPLGPGGHLGRVQTLGAKIMPARCKRTGRLRGESRRSVSGQG
jgi:hypothetical protein